MRRTAIVLCALIGLCGGCQRYFLDGGRPYHLHDGVEVLVRYRAEGTSAPAGVSFSLVRTRHGIGIFEQSPDGSGSLTSTMWQADGHEHYALWIKRGPAFEYVVPTDHTKPAQRFVYPVGAYEIQELGDMDRPVPIGSPGAPLTLVPEVAGEPAPAVAPPPAAPPPAAAPLAAASPGCTADTDCRHGRVCRSGACVAPGTCTRDVDCPNDGVCEQGTCR